MRKIILYILLGACICVCSVWIPKLLAQYKKNVPEKQVVFIPLECTYSQFLDSIYAAVKDINSFVKVAKWESLETKFKPGRYILTPDKTNKDLIRMLSNGWESPMMLTLSGNIRNLEKLSGILGKKLAADSLTFIQYFSDDTVCSQFGFDMDNFKGMIIPNTYEVYWTISPQKFLQRMKSEYDKFWNSERLAKAQEIGLTQQEVTILASIVCEETNYIPEMPKIAGVYMNRLQRGIKLDADPTVKYALGDPSIKRILFKHLKVDSPYNTYLNKGLPPGPITIPSIKGLDAVLNYETHNYLYFCASPALDGTHKFASTLSEHNRNARAYQAVLNRKKIK